MNHSSNNEDVLWYIDNISKVKEDLYEVVGWIFHKHEKINEIIIEDIPIEFKSINRPDVQKVYPYIPTSFVGFSFTISKEQAKKQISIDTKGPIILNIGSLYSWFISKTGGFNNLNKDLIVINNFYKDPDSLRDFAINNLSFNFSEYHKGKRSERFILDGTKEAFEQIIGRKIYNWNHDKYANGVFQYCTKDDPIVYHVDTQTYAGLVFLSPNSPLSSGTATYKSKITGASHFTNEEMDSELFINTFKGYGDEINFYDGSYFEEDNKIGNVYNRLVLFNSKSIHAATEYYGSDINDSRFFHLFFFDVK